MQKNSAEHNVLPFRKPAAQNPRDKESTQALAEAGYMPLEEYVRLYGDALHKDFSHGE